MNWGEKPTHPLLLFSPARPPAPPNTHTHNTHTHHRSPSPDGEAPLSQARSTTAKSAVAFHTFPASTVTGATAAAFSTQQNRS